jgi:hypothetical protein
MTEADPGQQFTVSLEGVQLPPEVVERIHRAVHRAVLSEIADIDLSLARGVRFVGWRGDHRRITGCWRRSGSGRCGSDPRRG